MILERDVKNTLRGQNVKYSSVGENSGRRTLMKAIEEKAYSS